MDWETSKKPLVLAHRGFTKDHVENSLEAVEAAMKLGVDGVEVDLRLTADGELVVFHDRDLKRLAGREEEIEEITLSRIRTIDLDGCHLPTLEELLDLAKDQILLNLEIKSVRYFSAAVEKKLVSSLKAFHLKASILISCFHPLPLWRLKRMEPDLKRGYLFMPEYWRVRYRPWVEKILNPFALNAPEKMADPSFVDAAGQRGRRIFVWTVNRPDAMRRCVDMGVHGIFSDRPDLLMEQLQKS